ncbi:phosphate ABC transporter ATP-binding protein [Thermoplasmatales archaeon SW_10_69_26]|nr:MAG: phosphate ABC transporter ATP-binding protein [Thermoplasmatales archaeon SW_10_69_26]
MVMSNITVEDLNVWYGDDHALKNINMEIPEGEVTALIGASGCGKSTFLRCFNRMNDEIGVARVEGSIRWKGVDLNGEDVDPVALRRRVGMVFQKPNPFPKTVYDNIAYGVSLNGRGDDDMDQIVETSLEQANLWDEVEDRLDKNALTLSGGQQQRLCIARAVAVKPDVILMDEPASALDPVSTQKIENLIEELREEYTVVVVTHNMQQAARISDKTAHLHLGELVEFDNTDKIFENPEEELTEAYITGRFG